MELTNEPYETDSSDTVKRLKRQIYSLQAQLAQKAQRSAAPEGNGLLRTDLEDYYPGEQLDFLLSLLRQAQTRCAPDSRPYEIIRALLEANRPVGRGEEILKELGLIFRDGSALTEQDVSRLNALGFTYTPSRKHPKLRFHGKYMFVLPSTPGDSRRGGMNALKEIGKCIAVGLKL